MIPIYVVQVNDPHVVEWVTIDPIALPALRSEFSNQVLFDTFRTRFQLGFSSVPFFHLLVISHIVLTNSGGFMVGEPREKPHNPHYTEYSPEPPSKEPPSKKNDQRQGHHWFEIHSK
jgi:hypothetical protein